MRRLLIFTLLLSTVLIFTVTTATAQAEESQYPGSETSETVDAPIFFGWMLPILGSMRRHRHELNERVYTRPENIIDENSPNYIA